MLLNGVLGLGGRISFHVITTISTCYFDLAVPQKTVIPVLYVVPVASIYIRP